MKCKFERKTIYGNQVFLAGKTYDLTNRDAEALGFKKAAKTEEKQEKADKADKSEE